MPQVTMRKMKMGEEAIPIDVDHLDLECHDLPEQVFHASEQVSECEEKLGRAKSDLKKMETEVEMKLRKNPTKYQLGEKPTQAAFATKVAAEPEIIEQNDKILLREGKLKRAKNIVTALTEKRRMLVELISLYGMNYVSSGFSDNKHAEKAKSRLKDKRARNQLRKDDD